MRAAAVEALGGAPTADPTEIIAVGGTASNLVKVLPAAMADRMLTRDRIAEIQAILAEETAAAAAERHLINPIRARILPAGAAIVDAILERYGADGDPRLRGRPPRGRDPRRRRTPARPGATACPTWPTAGEPERRRRRGATSPATTRPSVRRKVTPATPRHGPRSSAAAGRPRARG